MILKRKPTTSGGIRNQTLMRNHGLEHEQTKYLNIQREFVIPNLSGNSAEVASHKRWKYLLFESKLIPSNDYDIFNTYELNKILFNYQGLLFKILKCALFDLLPQSRVEKSWTTWSGSIIAKISHHHTTFWSTLPVMIGLRVEKTRVE